MFGAQDAIYYILSNLKLILLTYSNYLNTRLVYWMMPDMYRELTTDISSSQLQKWVSF